jgi:hypothetical protein
MKYVYIIIALLVPFNAYASGDIFIIWVLLAEVIFFILLLLFLFKSILILKYKIFIFLIYILSIHIGIAVLFLIDITYIGNFAYSLIFIMSVLLTFISWFFSLKKSKKKVKNPFQFFLNLFQNDIYSNNSLNLNGTKKIRRHKH